MEGINLQNEMKLKSSYITTCTGFRCDNRLFFAASMTLLASIEVGTTIKKGSDFSPGNFGLGMTKLPT